MRRVTWLALVALVVGATAASAAPGPDPAAHVAGLTKLHLHVEGIACDACSKRLRDALTKLPGVLSVAVDRASSDVAVDFDPAKTSEGAIRAEVTNHGFSVK
jgi:copper chaperone CopZ